MFDEEGRKIDLGYQIGMPLKQMSVTELNTYLDAITQEIERVNAEIAQKKDSTAAAYAFFK